MGPSFYSKQFSRIKQSFPIWLQACLTMTMQWKPGSNLSFQGQKPTGLTRKPCMHLLTIFSHLILMKEKSSLGFQSHRRASGKLTSGRSAILRNFGIGCASNIWISTSCQEAAQEFTNPVMLGFSDHSNYRQGNLTMKILSTIFWRSWTKAILHHTSMIALELFIIRVCDGCGMCIKLWIIKNLLKRYVSAWIKARSYLFFRRLKAALYTIGIYCIPVWRASRHEKHYETWGPQTLNSRKNLLGDNPMSNCLMLLKHCKRTLNSALS